MRLGKRLLRSNLFRWDAAGVVGGLLGLIALFQNWYYWPGFSSVIGPPGSLEWTLIRWDPLVSGMEMIHRDPNGLGAGVLLFAIGSVVVLFTRIGFVPQAAGLLMFLGGINHLEHTASMGFQIQLFSVAACGYALAVTAFLIASFGTYLPLWRRTAPRYAPSAFRVLALSPNACRIER